MASTPLLRLETPLAHMETVTVQEGLTVKNMKYRYLSPKLLLVGSIFGVLGVVFTVTNTLMVWHDVRTNELGLRYASGYGYWPLTVSEAVSEDGTSSNKVFLAFCLLGGFSIFASWYPYHLQNAYTRDGAFCGSTKCIRLATLRQVLPAAGLILLAIVPMKPKPLQTFTDKVSLLLHGVGALMTFVGYFACEFHALYVAKAHAPKEGLLHNSEAVVRIILCVVFLLSFAVFGACYVIDKLNTQQELKDQMCCVDVWKTLTYNVTYEVDGELHQSKEWKTILYDTAKGPVFIIKVIGYVGEVTAFMAMMLNHIAIWYFCGERRSFYSEQILADPIMLPEKTRIISS